MKHFFYFWFKELKSVSCPNYAHPVVWALLSSRLSWDAILLTLSNSGFRTPCRRHPGDDVWGRTWRAGDHGTRRCQCFLHVPLHLWQEAGCLKTLPSPDDTDTRLCHVMNIWILWTFQKDNNPRMEGLIIQVYPRKWRKSLGRNESVKTCRDVLLLGHVTVVEVMPML